MYLYKLIILGDHNCFISYLGDFNHTNLISVYCIIHSPIPHDRHSTKFVEKHRALPCNPNYPYTIHAYIHTYRTAHECYIQIQHTTSMYSFDVLFFVIIDSSYFVLSFFSSSFLLSFFCSSFFLLFFLFLHQSTP